MRVVGKFPIFAKLAKLGKLRNAKGKNITSGDNSFYYTDKLGYDTGFSEMPTPEQLNGVLNYITSAISHLYTRGLPEFALNVAYPKGAVVTYDGDIYLSLSDNNTMHITYPNAWVQLNKPVEPVVIREVDGNPIGTILTVPVTTVMEGYIDYVENTTFDKGLYPRLYQILGTDRFNSVGVSGTDLPIGSIIHSLSNNRDVPDGYIEWSTRRGILASYPELKHELEVMANRLEDKESKHIWLEALKTNSLPYFNDFYLGLGNVGELSEDSIRATELVSLPVIVDRRNNLNPLGVTRCVVEDNTHAVVTNDTTAKMKLESDIVVTAVRATDVQHRIDASLYTTTVGKKDGVTRPRTLSTRIFIKAVHQAEYGISSTHKRIIKAF